MTEKNYAFFQNNIFNTLYLTLFDLIAKKKIKFNWWKNLKLNKIDGYFYIKLNSKIYLTIKLWL